MTAVERAVVVHRRVRLLVNHELIGSEAKVVVVEHVIRRHVGDVMRVELNDSGVLAVTEDLSCKIVK